MALEEFTLRAKNEVIVDIKYVSKNGPIMATYSYKLKSKSSNEPIEIHTGDNQNSQDDSFYLPSPIKLNKDRYILISSEIAAIDRDTDFKIIVSVLQDNFKPEVFTIIGRVSANNDSINKLLMLKIL
jgi:hypothetical protein